VLPCTALLTGEYGIDGLYMGVPVVLGDRGIERVIELELSESESEELHRSAEAVKEVVAILA
jgi:malate dehydrogenase